ncbi:MAG TPA: flagellar biosynthesis protein FlhB [Rhodobiaceae bacterium]|jgi:flagellar biosynthetic protein FlhB|nr:flagellar biosynthesis protein FlhB [Rhodobiaceae bacterium]|tara:strand:+ start:4994 stop:6145 length:1152 start_codon:yes stop_codon:yes gene_type:complete
MAEENQDSQEKTEEPSQRKLDKAREDGKVVTSKEMFVFTSLAAGLITGLAIMAYGNQPLMHWGGLFTLDAKTHIDALILAHMDYALWFLIQGTIIFGLPIMIVTILTQFGVGGIIFAPKALSFKGSRISPIAGFKRMFSMKALVELGKSILKVVFLFGIGFVTIVYFMPGIIWFPNGTMANALNMMTSLIPSLIGGLLIGLFIIAVLDFAWQRFDFMKQMRMSRQDQKDEFKQTEGSPEVKAKIRRMQMEASANASKQREALEEVSEATAVITNPTHFAVALKYEVGSAGAPTVLAMGRGVMAEQIIERAKQAEVTVFQSPLLARALFFTSEIGGEISEALYNAVAVVLAYIYRVDQGDVAERPDVDVPRDLRYAENGQLLEE